MYLPDNNPAPPTLGTTLVEQHCQSDGSFTTPNPPPPPRSPSPLHYLHPLNGVIILRINLRFTQLNTLQYFLQPRPQRTALFDIFRRQFVHVSKPQRQRQRDQLFQQEQLSFFFFSYISHILGQFHTLTYPRGTFVFISDSNLTLCHLVTFLSSSF